MGSYIDSLNDKQLTNLKFMIKRMSEKGITNDYIQAGILAVVSKESSFIPKSERSYSGTSNDRIRKIFGSRVKDLSESQLTALKKDPEKFFNKVYGGRYGNAPDEGYKYRGRGLNQLTFKANYEKVNKYTNVDIVAKPDKLNTIEVAADALIGFFKREFSKSSAKLSEYNMTDINSAKSIADAVGAAYHANTGWGKKKEKIEQEPTGGYKKAIARVGEIYVLTKAADTATIASSAESVSATSSANENLPIVYNPGKVVQEVKELQKFLNRFIDKKIGVDGKAGKNTSDACFQVLGYYLKGDPRV